MADTVNQNGGTPRPKRTASSPLVDENMKKHHGDDIDEADLAIHWEDDTDESSQADQPHELGNPGKPQTTSSMEAKIDKMLQLYMTLDSKIQKGNQISNERLTNLRNAHNNLVKKFVDQRADIVERDIRISNLESDLGNTKQDLDYTKQDLERVMQELAKTKLVVGDLIHTTGMVNTRIDYVEKSNLDQWVEIKEKKIIFIWYPRIKRGKCETSSNG